MIHTNTTDFIKIETSSDADIDVAIDYSLQGGLNQKTDYIAIASATDTNVTLDDAAPCEIHSLSVFNKDSVDSCIVSIFKTKNSVDYLAFRATLAIGESIQYQGTFKVFTADGKLKVQTASSGGSVDWGGIGGTLSNQTDLQSALNAKQNTITNSDDITEGSTNLFMTSAEALKLANIEANADVTDSANVATAGAFMKSSDDSDDITEGAAKLFMTTSERSKLSAIEANADVTDAANVGAVNFAASGKTTPVDADSFPITDSAASNVIKKVTFANLKTWISNYYNSLTATLTNKRITARVTTITSSATPTVNTNNCDTVTITALAVAITSMTTNLSGTPTNFQKLIYRIKDDGTARAITWGASFEAKGVALPTTTVAGKVLTVGFIYDTVSAKWGCVASVNEE